MLDVQARVGWLLGGGPPDSTICLRCQRHHATSCEPRVNGWRLTLERRALGTTPSPITHNDTMAELSPEERIKLAVQFIAQSPPGEVK